MSTLNELGHALRARRLEIGLTQAQVAAMSGLSRQTVNRLEAGAVPDLGIKKAERLSALLGLVLRVDTGRQRFTQRRMSPLMRAAATASVSYRTQLQPEQLKELLVQEKMPEKFAPHLHAFLDDAPISLLAAVAEQLDAEMSIPRNTVWKTYRKLAQQVKSRRDIWQ